MTNPVKSLGYMKCYASSRARLIKSLAILSDTNIRRPAVDRQDLKLHWQSQNWPHSTQ